MTIDDYLAGLAGPLRDIGEKLKPIIEDALPGAAGAMWHGHPVWSLGDRPGRRPVCLVKAYGSHVSFALWRGQEIDDASGRLVAGARAMAAVRLHRVDEIDPALFTGLLRTAAALEEV